MIVKTILSLSVVSLLALSASTPQKGINDNPGKWSKADVKQFKSDCMGVKEIQDLGKLGQDLCDCMLDKSQTKYPSYALANNDEEGLKKIGEACALEVTGNIKSGSSSGSKVGKWSKEDKKTFMDDCKGVKEIKDLGKLGDQLCDCMLKKSEQTFSSFREADSDEARMEAIGLKCAEEVVGKMKK